MRSHRRLAVTIVAAATVFASVFGIAASLNVTAAGLGAGAATVASCDTDGVTTGYTVAYSAAAGGYAVSTVNVSGIATPDCNGRTMKVTLVGASDASLAEKTVTLGAPAADPTSFNFASDGVDAEDVVKVAVVLY